jgi:hypothetical protein
VLRSPGRFWRSTGPLDLLDTVAGVLHAGRKTPSARAAGGPYWRYSANDAVYGLGGNIVRASDSDPGDSSNARFIGTQLEFVAEWIPFREFAFLISYSQVISGSFIRETGPSETIHFFAVEAVIQF